MAFGKLPNDQVFLFQFVLGTLIQFVYNVIATSVCSKGDLIVINLDFGLPFILFVTRPSVILRSHGMDFIKG